MLPTQRQPSGSDGDITRRANLGWLAAGLWSAAMPASGARVLGRQRVRIAFIDPLSGPAADIGRNGLRTWQYLASRLAGDDRAAGPRLTVVGFDNKGSPQESLNALKAAIDQGFRYVVQGNGSGVAAVIVDAVERHNLRYPDRAVLYINYAAMDPVLTQEKCSYWHVRVDADTAMKTQALARFFTLQPGIERVYLLNQNYAHGQQVSKHLKEALQRYAPQVRVVGDELHPPFQGQDFVPLVQRMKVVGAQALVTGNWGRDMADLVACMVDQQVDTPLYAYYPSLPGTPPLLADPRRRFPVYQVACGHTNPAGPLGDLVKDFRRDEGEDLVVFAAYDAIAMLLRAMTLAESTDVARVVVRISGMIFNGFTGPVQVRSGDHQLQKGVFLSRWEAVSAAYPEPSDDTGYTFVPVKYFDAAAIGSPSVCHMRRP